MKTKEEILKIYSAERLNSLEDLPNEIWKQHPEYKDNYVSNLGRVKSADRKVKHNYGGYAVKKSRILKQSLAHGYLICGITINSKTTTKKVHRLIAETFLETDTSRLFVNHINGIKTDNRVENLEWVTAQENTQHAWRLGLNKPSIDKIAHEKFKIISHYLNHDIQVKTPIGKGSVIMGNTCLVIIYENGKQENLIKSLRSWGSEFKIILREMDMITKEIEHKGERFIPLYRLMKEDKGFGVDFIDVFGVEEMKVSCYDLLLEWHFNVFGLNESEYIKKESIK